MEEQLFRFSVLRAPEPASDRPPIIVRSFQDQQPADQLVPVVHTAVTWLKSKEAIGRGRSLPRQRDR